MGGQFFVPRMSYQILLPVLQQDNIGGREAKPRLEKKFKLR